MQDNLGDLLRVAANVGSEQSAPQNILNVGYSASSRIPKKGKGEMKWTEQEFAGIVHFGKIIALEAM